MAESTIKNMVKSWKINTGTYKNGGYYSTLMQIGKCVILIFEGAKNLTANASNTIDNLPADCPKPSATMSVVGSFGSESATLTVYSNGTIQLIPTATTYYGSLVLAYMI